MVIFYSHGGNKIFKFFKDKLKLPINREKSNICRPVNFTIPGFYFVPTYTKGEKGKYQLVVSGKSQAKLKQKFRLITKKTILMNFDQRIYKLIEIQRGWINNLCMASIYNSSAMFCALLFAPYLPSHTINKFIDTFK